MNTRVRKSLQPMNTEKEKMGVEMSKPMETQNGTTKRKGLIRQRKMELQQDVDKLKKKLRHEENVHRALERAFNRPLGALPRLPPYLPPYTLELLAEVAVLEEEVVRLEEQVVHFRQGLYNEALYISSSKRNTESSVDLYDPYPVKNSKQKQSKLSVQAEGNLGISSFRQLPSLQDDGRGKENQLSGNSPKIKPSTKVQMVKTPIRRSSIEAKFPERHSETQKIECRVEEPESIVSPSPCTGNGKINGNENANEISENILKCLSNIYLRMSSSKNRATMDSLPSLSALKSSEANEFKDPYGICSEFDNREIGPYRNLFAIEARSINLSRNTSSMFLVCRLKLLLGKLASINLKGLTHQEKLAFWINTYNSCMMNAFLEHGIPDTAEKVVELMKKAIINVGGHLLKAITIEHFILRLPYHSRYTFAKGVRNDEMIARSAFALELSEPLITFALSCGSWSSPAVRVYTASQVEKELEAAKRDYLQAAIGFSSRKKLLGVPKLLDWYLLDFAKDIDSLLDWVCHQLPNEIGKEAIKCLDRGNNEPVSKFVRVAPYEFNFRYLLHL